MQTILAFEAKTHFSKLLAQVERGEEILVTRHGHVVAKISPAIADGELTKLEAVARLKSFSRRYTLNGLDWKALRDEGRR